MSSLIPFYILTITVGAMLAVALWFVACRVLARRQIDCPGHGVSCQVDFEQVRRVPWQASDRFEVARCELLGWGAKIDCDQACKSQCRAG